MSEPWLLVVEDGTVREIEVTEINHGTWRASIGGVGMESSTTARTAIVHLAGRLRLPVVEIVAPGEHAGGDGAMRSMFAAWLRDRADDVVNDDPAAAETLYLAERDFRSTFRRGGGCAGDPIDIDAIEAMAKAATANVSDDGYRLRAPADGDGQGAVIVEYKSSEHPNADNDGALFGHAREYVLALAAAVRVCDTRLSAVVDQSRRFVKAYERNAEYCERRYGEVSGEWAQEYARKGVTCRGAAVDMSMVVRIAEGEEK